MVQPTLSSDLERIEFAPVTENEIAHLRGTCERIMAGGGELGEIARDMLKTSDGLTELINKVDKFLKS